MEKQGANAVRLRRLELGHARDALLAALSQALAEGDTAAVSAIERAIAELDRARRSRDDDRPVAGQLPDVLSARELEVVRLVAYGFTDKQIAEALVISPRTVQSHVSSALRKTGARRRTELAAMAIQEGHQQD